MSHLALYRKTRPQRFQDLIGQDAISTTLRNQVKNERFSHAYLFCGTRGTGKTSAAKILARAVNCLSPIDGEPCGHCKICQLTDNPDIYEIDAASNNGVDQIRELRENVRFAALESRYKVYIIDEVHMLSSGAFNALLKTLEEPPSHVIFLLATTEPQKLPPTILSRCQRFDFRRISVADIESHLANVLTDMGVRYDERALKKLALLADGGMRDALSLTEQCLSFSGGKTLTYEQVLSSLGSIDDRQRFALVDALLQRDRSASLIALSNALSAGNDIGVLSRDLADHFRSLTLVLSCGDQAASLLSLDTEDFLRYNKQAQQTNLAFVLRAIDLLCQCDRELRRASQPRILLEMTLLRISCETVDTNTDAILARLAALESQSPRTAENISFQVGTRIPIDPPREQAQVAREIEPPKAEAAIPEASLEDVQPRTLETLEAEQPPADNSLSAPDPMPLVEQELPQASSHDSAGQPDAEMLFNLLQDSQGEGIRQIFRLYHWELKLRDNTLYLRAPSACIPALFQTLKSKESAFAESLQNVLPNAAVCFLSATDPLPDQSASSKTAVSSDVVSAETTSSSLDTELRHLFGDQALTSQDES